MSNDLFAAVVGQPAAVEQLRAAARRPVHAYLFVGPAGSGKHTAALALAGALLCEQGGCGDCTHCRRVSTHSHPDLVVVEREGASISVAQAREITRLAALSPVEGSRKVLILDDFHLVEEAAPALLKTIEEASESTVFLILAETVPHTLATVASRCVRVDFSALSDAVIERELLQESVAPERAVEIAGIAHGSLDRARLLAHDDTASDRRQLWLNVLDRLNGTGAAIVTVVDDLVVALDAAAEPLLVQQAENLAEATERAKEGGQGTGVLKGVEARQKRELRRLRTDELRFDFGLLHTQIGERLAATDNTVVTKSLLDGLEALCWANGALAHNPNESMLLHGLFVRLTETVCPAQEVAAAR